MTQRIVSLVILAEDLAAATFLRRYAQRIVDRRAIRIIIAPAGHGSGEQFVRQNYPIEAKVQRRNVRGKLANSALIVHIDTDTGATPRIYQQLADALEADGQSRRLDSERIAIVAPRRNIETWIYGLTDNITNEDYDYKRDTEHIIGVNTSVRNRLRQQSMKPAAEQLFQLTRNNAPPPPDNMPSLQLAIPELCRLD